MVISFVLTFTVINSCQFLLLQLDVRWLFQRSTQRSWPIIVSQFTKTSPRPVVDSSPASHHCGWPFNSVLKNILQTRSGRPGGSVLMESTRLWSMLQLNKFRE